MAPRIYYPVPDLDIWSGSKYQIPRVQPATYDNSVTAFEVPHIRFEDDARDDVSWQFQYVLGQGGFGLVGLWSKIDETDMIVDDLAVKEMPMPRDRMFQLTEGGRRIPEEAIIMTAMMKKGCYPVMQMRGMSILTAPDDRPEKLRYYLEFCPAGTLWHVLRNYNRLLQAEPQSVENVPEAYLWQLLFDFSVIMVDMEQKPFHHPNDQNLGESPFILHLDLKGENVMLGYPDDEAVAGYPATKLGDWGLARLTSLGDSENSYGIRFNGTPHWYPPEQDGQGQFGRLWQEQPPWRSPDGQFNHPYTTAHSVFAFAAIIFRLMVIDADGRTLDNLMARALVSEDDVRARRFKYIQSNDMDVNTHGRPTRYSPLLKDTIASCLNINPAFRPGAEYINHLAYDMCAQNLALEFQNGPDTFPQLRTADLDPGEASV